MSEKTITGLYKEPGKPMTTRTVPHTLRNLQELVGGYIQAVTICTDCVILCNEEGKLMDLPANFVFAGELFVGPVFIVGYDEEDLTDLKLSATSEKHLKASIDGGDCFGRQYHMP